MRIHVEIDDSVYNFLESKNISVATLINVFILRSEHLVKETHSKAILSKQLDYKEISRRISETAEELDRESKAINQRSKSAKEEIKQKKIERQEDEHFL